jgi:eukaryotic-like serine/threonine-protein kinase
LTPDYASPEQIGGRAIGTSSDVYSLGVVFYELLCGRRPYRLARGGRAALEQAISASDPKRPSRTIEAAQQAELAALRSAKPAGLRRQLEGDLDNVALKALEKQPSRRYASAEAFSLDLQRWLAGMPVQAHPAGAAYRAAKFVRRHRVAVSAAALAAVSLATGTGVALHQARLAEREALRARAVQRFVTGLFQEAAPARAQGRDVLVRDLMDRGERELHDAAADDPALRADLSGVLAELYLDLADGLKALPLAEAHRDAVRSLHGPHSLAHGQALAALAAVQSSLSRLEPGLQTLYEARRIFERHGHKGSDAIVDLMPREAHFLQQLNRPAEAIAVMEKAVPLLQARHGRDGWPALKAQVDLATALSNGGDSPRALQILADIAPLVDAPRPALGLHGADMLGNIGYIQWQARRFDEAERTLKRTIAEFDRLAGPRNSPAIEAGRTLGMVQLDAGHYAQAAQTLGRNTERAVAFYGEQDGEAALNRSFEVMALMRTDQPARAEASAAESVRVSEAPGATSSSAAACGGGWRPRWC